MPKKRTNYNCVILPLNLIPEELEHLRSTMPHGERSGIIRQLLREAGYLPPQTEKSPGAA